MAKAPEQPEVETVFRVGQQYFKTEEEAQAWLAKRKDFDDIRQWVRVILADILPDLETTVVHKVCHSLMNLPPEGKAALVKALS